MAATSSGSAKLTLPNDTEILITREFDAPPHLVWQAWTTPDLVKQWWTANRGEATVADIDLRVGGKWRYVMVTHEGGMEVGFHGEYLEIVENERLVSTEAYEGIPDADAQAATNTLTLTPLDGGRTRMEIRVEHPNREGRDMHLASGMEGGLQDALDLLEGLARRG